MGYRSALLVIVLAMALSAGCSHKPDDAALVTNIKAQLFSDAQMKGAALDVTSSNGQVTLKGVVSSDAAKYEAYKIATQTPGVAKVNDEMTVELAQAPTTPPIAVPVPPAPPVAPPSKSEVKESRHKAPPPPTDKHGKNKTNPDSEPVETAANSSAPPPGYPVDQSSATPAAPPPQAVPPPVSAPPAPVPAPPPPPQPRQVAIPASSTITIRMIDAVDSSVNQAGEIFHASLDAPIVVDNDVIVPKGADVYVRLASASSAGHLSGKSELHLELIKLEFQGQSYPLVSSTYSLSGASRGKNTAEKVGGGAVLGALLGAIAGGGKGAAIGAGVGGGAGGVYQGVTKGKQVKIPSETKLDFQLDQPVTVTVMPRSSNP